MGGLRKVCRFFIQKLGAQQIVRPFESMQQVNKLIYQPSMNPLAAKKSFSREQLNIIRTMLRIDLAGEIAANRIYQGQKHAFRGDSSTLNLIDAMHEQERRHLAQLRQLCRVYNVTPSKATPLAHGLSYVVGKHACPLKHPDYVRLIDFIQAWHQDG